MEHLIAVHNECLYLYVYMSVYVSVCAVFSVSSVSYN